MSYPARRSWKLWWRTWLGWVPLQWCMVCGRPYWGGFPRPAFRRIGARPVGSLRWIPGLRWQWLPWWKDYCSHRCARAEMDELGRS